MAPKHQPKVVFCYFWRDKLPRYVDINDLIELIASEDIATVRNKYPYILWYGDIQGTLAVHGSARGAYVDQQSIMVENH